MKINISGHSQENAKKLEFYPLENAGKKSHKINDDDLDHMITY